MIVTVLEMAGKKSRARGSKKRSRNNNNRKKSQPASNGGWASGGVRSGGAAGVQTPGHAKASHAELCSALCNPFSDACRGMKYPDGLNGRSIPVQVKYANHAVVDSNGFLAVHVNSALPYGVLVSSAISVAGLATWNTAWSSHVLPSIVSAQGRAYRVVCWGIRITCESPVPDTGGTLMVSTLQEPASISVNPNPLSYWQIGNYLGVETVSYPLTTGKSVIWVGKPQGPRLFRPVGNDNAIVTPLDDPFTSVVFSVAGGVASKTRIAYEVVLNVELTLTQAGLDAGLGHLSGHDPVPNTAGLAMANHVASRLPSAYESHDSLRSQLMAEVRNALGSVGKAAVGRASRAAVAAIGGGM